VFAVVSALVVPEFLWLVFDRGFLLLVVVVVVGVVAAAAAAVMVMMVGGVSVVVLAFEFVSVSVFVFAFVFEGVRGLVGEATGRTIRKSPRLIQIFFLNLAGTRQRSLSPLGNTT